MKDILANTDLKVDKLVGKLESCEGFIGFDTEVVGPLLQGRDFVNIIHSVLLGLSIAFEDGEAYYLPMRHKGNNATFAQLDRVAAHLENMPWRVFAHNAKFDQQVMMMAGHTGMWMYCTMIAAWLVERRNYGLSLEALGVKGAAYDPSISYKSGQDALAYACQDARGALELGLKYVAGDDLFSTTLDLEWYKEECQFAKILAEMKLQGFRIDHGKLRGLKHQATKELTRIESEWKEVAPNISITSSKQLQELFFEGTWTAQGKTAGGQVATGKAVMEWNAKNARTPTGRGMAQLRLDYQEVAKIVTTYTDGLIEEARQWADQKLHPDLHHFGTITGRLSSAYPNIQNQPAHGDYAARLRECFIPDPGMEFTSADYSQIELRYFANYTGGALLNAFENGLDLHQVTADAVGVDRQLGKTINFGFLLYGGGPRKMAGLLQVSEKEAAVVLDKLQASFPEIEQWRQKVVRVASDRGPLPWVKTLMGRYRWVPELNPAQFRKHDPEGYEQAARAIARKYKLTSRERIDSAMESRGRRLVVNYLVQGGSRDLLVLGMNSYRRMAPAGFKIITTVHDEVLTQHPKGGGETARHLLKTALELAGPKMNLRVPVLAEPKTGATWAEVK